MQNFCPYPEFPALHAFFHLPVSEKVRFPPQKIQPISAVFLYPHFSNVQSSSVFGGFHGSVSSVQDGHTSLRKQDEQEGFLA